MTPAARIVLISSALGAIAFAGCGSDGTTPSCRVDGGVPLYNIKEADPDSGLLPDATVNEINQDLVDMNCLTAIGHLKAVPDSGSD
jgi:hypothetical protein